MGSIVVSTVPSGVLYNGNAQVMNFLVVDGGLYAQTPPVIKYISDLTVTASLYSGRDITNPVATPGTLVAAWATGGQIVVPYTANGIYQVTVPASVIPVTPLAGSFPYYVLVLDAPVSASGYILHRERQMIVQTAEF